MTKRFINLTNGIEHIPDLLADNKDFSFIRIQSTTLERKDWVKLFSELDYNLLMYLARGYQCIVYDCGANKTLSKTIYQGLPIIEYVLNRRWLGIEGKAHRLTRSGEKVNACQKWYSDIYDLVFTYNTTKEKKLVKSKLDYFKKYVSGTPVDLCGVPRSTQNDGDNEFYIKIINNNLNTKIQ